MKNKAYILVYNPLAGKNHSERIACKIEELLIFNKHKTAIVNCDNKNNIIKIYNELSEKYEPVFVVFGGDGTLSIFINFMLSNNLNCPICIYPSGTANDFSTCLKIPKKCCKFVDMLLAGNTIITDVALVNSIYCINAIGSGNFSNGCTVYTKHAKKFWGKLGYYFKCVLLSFNLKPAYINLKVNTQDYSGEYLFFYCVNSKTAGGFRLFAPLAELNDSTFDFIGVKKCGFFSFWKLVFKILFGKHLNDKNIIYVKSTNFEMYVEEKNTLFEKCDVDGNCLDSKKIKMEVVPNKLTFICLNKKR